MEQTNFAIWIYRYPVPDNYPGLMKKLEESRKIFIIVNFTIFLIFKIVVFQKTGKY